MMAGEMIGVFALGWLFSQWMNSDMPENGPETPSTGLDDEKGPDLPPPEALSPDALGKPLFYVEQKGANSDGLVVAYCLYQLEGAAYLMPDGSIDDQTEYMKVGFVVGNASASAFISQNRGGFDFILDGIEYNHVTIYTESEAMAKVTDSDDDSSGGPEKAEPNPEYDPTPSYNRPDYSVGLGGGSRYGGIA